MVYIDEIDIDASMTIGVDPESDRPDRDVERSPESPEGGTIAQSQ